MHWAKLLLAAAFIIGVFQTGSIDDDADVERAPASTSTIRLDTGIYSMVHVSPRDQKFFPDCFANIGAEIIDAYRFSHGDKDTSFRTSALVLAGAYEAAKGSGQIQNGFVCNTVNTVKSSGICNDSALRTRHGFPVEFYIWRFIVFQKQIEALYSFQTALDELSATYNKEIVGDSRQPAKPDLNETQLACVMTQDFNNQLSAGQLDRQLRQIATRLRLKSDVENEIVKLKAMLLRTELHFVQNRKLAPKYAQLNAEAIVQQMTKGGFSARELPSVAKLKEILDHGNPVQLLNEITQKSCTGTDMKRPSLPNCVRTFLKPTGHANPNSLPKNAAAVTSTWAKNYALKLSRAFDRPNPQPFSIGMCAEATADAGFDSHFSVTGYPISCKEKHAILVIGRRINPRNGRLDFLVRDSRSPECPGPDISRQWECAGPATFWMGAEALIRNTWTVEGFDLPPL